MMQVFEWHTLMAAGIRGLGLKPSDFWNLTPAELGFLLGEANGHLPMARAALDELAARFPDEMENEDV